MTDPLEEFMARQAANKERRREGVPPSVVFSRARFYMGLASRSIRPSAFGVVSCAWRLAAREHLFNTLPGMRTEEEIQYALGILDEVERSGVRGPAKLSTTYRDLDGAELDFPLRQSTPRSKERF